MGAAVDLLEQASTDEEACGHLHRECPWFRHVGEGGSDDIEAHCRPAWPGGEPPEAHGPPRLVVKLTPRTPEASTVRQPTVPPGGPGLFHVKGLQLPPYVQHLYRHLVGRYGKHDAYRVAVGVVKKWAAGVNPGGWQTKSGKGKRTHPDVRAAAQKNVAEWEADRAEGHAHHESHGDHAAATAPLAARLAVPAVTAPGAKPLTPNAAAGPRAPLPPHVPMPAPAELTRLAGMVPPCADEQLASSVRKHLSIAAVKLEKGSPLEALALLRSVQAGILAAHKADLGASGSGITANVFTVVPADRLAAIAQTRDKTMAWRRLSQGVESAIDRIRKNFFHGVHGISGQPVRLAARLG
jgi:hypothetical protein